MLGRSGTGTCSASRSPTSSRSERARRASSSPSRSTARSTGSSTTNLRFVRYQWVDCRWELGRPERGRELYLAGHIPGASFLDVETQLSAPPGGAEGGRHPLPDAEAFARAAGAAGIGDDALVVAYDQGMNGGAARLWWLLRHFGHEDVAVLRGGLDAWVGPLRGGEEETEPREFVPRPLEG